MPEMVHKMQQRSDTKKRSLARARSSYVSPSALMLMSESSSTYSTLTSDGGCGCATGDFFGSSSSF